MKQLFTLLAMAMLATASSWATEETISLIDGSFADKVITWNGTSCKITQEQGKGSSAPNKSYIAAPRWYASNVVTFAAKDGYKITGAVVTCASSTYASALSGSTYTNATAAISGSTVTIKSDGNFTITLKSQSRISSVKVNYEKSGPQKQVSSLAITGTPLTTEYYVGDKFSTEGLTVTATYDDNSTEAVTPVWDFAPATFTQEGSVNVIATATYGGVSASGTYPVTVKTIANTKETAYTVAEAIALIDAGKGLNTPVYVKGVVSKITTAFDAKYGNVSFNVSDDGTTNAPQFMFFRNQKDAENKYSEDPNITVGASVIGYGTLTKYNSTYEFAAANYLVEYRAPELTGDINGDGVVNTDDVTALATSILENGDVTLATGDLNDDGVLDVTDVTILVNLILE